LVSHLQDLIGTHTNSLGGYTALSTKGVASLLGYTLFKALTFPIFYLLVLILVGTAIMQIKYINRALQRFDSTQVIPTQFVMFTLSVILGSAVLYRDFEKTRGDAAGKFIGGCAMTFLGVWLITSGRPTPPDNESDYDSDEEAIVLRPGEQYQDDIHVTADSQETLLQLLPQSIEEEERRRRSQSIRRSQGSLSESLRRSQWNPEHADSQRPGLGYGTSTPALPDSAVTDNAWIEASEQPKSGLTRFLQPLTSLFPTEQSSNNTAQTLPSVLQARHSTPALPTINDPESQIPPRTPRQNSIDPATLLGTSVSATGNPRNHLANRRSLNNLYPGPFTSPLSSSLSAMVSESLRRGIGIKRMQRRKSQRPPIPGREGSVSQARQRGQSAVSATTLGSLFPDHDGLLPGFEENNAARRQRSYSIEDDTDRESEPQTPEAGNRPRSLSVRLSEFFRRSRSGTTGQYDEPRV
jgi:hypothetical protein